jgi:hypothetical protein
LRQRLHCPANRHTLATEGKGYGRNDRRLAHLPPILSEGRDAIARAGSYLKSRIP